MQCTLRNTIWKRKKKTQTNGQWQWILLLLLKYHVFFQSFYFYRISGFRAFYRSVAFAFSLIFDLDRIHNYISFFFSTWGLLCRTAAAESSDARTASGTVKGHLDVYCFDKLQWTAWSCDIFILTCLLLGWKISLSGAFLLVLAARIQMVIKSTNGRLRVCGSLNQCHVWFSLPDWALKITGVQRETTYVDAFVDADRYRCGDSLHWLRCLGVMEVHC